MFLRNLTTNITTLGWMFTPHPGENFSCLHVEAPKHFRHYLWKVEAGVCPLHSRREKEAKAANVSWLGNFRWKDGRNFRRRGECSDLNPRKHHLWVCSRLHCLQKEAYSPVGASIRWEGSQTLLAALGMKRNETRPRPSEEGELRGHTFLEI